MQESLDTLLSHGPVVTDGAWGTQLQDRGLEVGACPDGWNLLHPERVEEVARAYVEAGSQVILTNTFGANRLTLARHRLDDRMAEINRAGVEISRRAAAGRAKVFASVGPSGVVLMMGDTPPEQVQDAFTEQVRVLAEAGADAIVLETFSDPVELRLAIAAVRQTGLPSIACLVFDCGKNHDRTLMGTTPEQAAAALTEAGADVIGSNCGQGIAGFVGICRRLRAVTDKPLWMKANAGLPKIVDDKTVYSQSPEQFAAVVPELIAAGANFVGGCCGTSPDFVAAVRKQLSP
jgi:5-methyltetrahydrofolate--homocysteine methyltransferase